MLKTKLYRDACVFLKAARCSVHSAKPRACRLYPLGIGPNDENPGAWLSFIVSKNPEHLSGQRRRVGDWVNANFSAEDRAFVAEDYLSTGELAKRVQRIDRRYEEEVVWLSLFYKYFSYDTTKDFMPQFTGNMELLKEQLKFVGNR